MYMMAKHLHLTAVGLSILFFIFRFIWSQFDSTALNKKWEIIQLCGRLYKGKLHVFLEFGPNL